MRPPEKYQIKVGDGGQLSGDEEALNFISSFFCRYIKKGLSIDGIYCG